MAGSGRRACKIARSIAAQAGPARLGRERMAGMSAYRDHKADHDQRFTRRAWLAGGGVVAALAGAGLIHQWRRGRESVFIAKNQSYDGDLVRTIRDGLMACDFVPSAVRGKRVLLKPNMVEPI